MISLGAPESSKFWSSWLLGVGPFHPAQKITTDSVEEMTYETASVVASDLFTNQKNVDFLNVYLNAVSSLTLNHNHTPTLVEAAEIINLFSQNVEIWTWFFRLCMYMAYLPTFGCFWLRYGLTVGTYTVRPMDASWDMTWSPNVLKTEILTAKCGNISWVKLVVCWPGWADVLEMKRKDMEWHG